MYCNNFLNCVLKCIFYYMCNLDPVLIRVYNRKLSVALITLFRCTRTLFCGILRHPQIVCMQTHVYI